MISFYAAMFVLPALLIAVTCFAAARLRRRGPGRGADGGERRPAAPSGEGR